MQVKLLNKGRKYDKLFKPNDRFSLQLKRLTWLQIMTGYLDSVPLFSVWPRSIQIAGSSTLKRLQYHFWDPGTPASFTLFNSAGTPTQTGQSDPYNDSGMTNKLKTLLTKVANWPENQIHVASLPNAWSTKVQALFESVAPALGGSMNSLSTGSIIAGASPYTSGIATNSFILVGGPAGSALPANFGNAVWYVGDQDIQSESSMYCQMQWSYRDPSGAPISSNFDPVQIKQFLAKQKLLICNPDTNMSVVVSIAGWGPSATAAHNPVIGLSKDAFGALGFNILDDPNNCNVQIGWVVKPDSTDTGPFNISDSNQLPSGDSPVIPSAVNQPPNGSLPTQYQASKATESGKAAQAALSFCQSVLGDPYGWGSSGPTSFDCSGLMVAAYGSAGVTIPRSTEEQYVAATKATGNLTLLPLDPSVLVPGDLIFYWYGGTDGPPDHVTMFAGFGSMYEAAHANTNVSLNPYRSDHLYGYARITGVGSTGTSTTASGNTDLTGTITSDTAAAGTSLPGGIQVVVGSNGQIETVGSDGQPVSASFITSWSWLEQAPDILSTLLTGYRALMNDVPFLPMVETICQASLRSFCSAPNGDFIAWFPDYFNVYQSLGTVSISDIELQDFTVNWSDLQMVTHQYTAGTYSPTSFDINNPGGAVSVVNQMNTGGVATIDFPQILQELFHLDPNDPTFSAEGIYARFGARPNYQSLGTIVGPEAEFWYALYLFQQNWAMQFAANVPICFMPELYPGIIMQIPSQKFQAYVQSVTHNFDLGPNGGFQTQVIICAPSEMGSPGLWGFPKAGT
jgi:cell wall-associated NlpC family hydrolase